MRIGVFILFLGFFCFVPKVLSFPDQSVVQIPVSVRPTILLLHPKERFLYVLDPSSQTFSVVDAFLFQEVSFFRPNDSFLDFCVSPDGKTLYGTSSVADQIQVYSLEDPSSPSFKEIISLPTSHVFFDQMRVGNSGDGDFLVLISFSEKRIFLYEIQTEKLRSNGSLNFIELENEPKSFSLWFNDLRLGVVDAKGVFQTFSTSSLSKMGNSLDLSERTSTSLFSHLEISSLPNGNFGFVSNSLEEGEIFLLDLRSSLNQFTLLDANPDQASLNPLKVGSQPNVSRVVPVARKSDDETSSGNYLYVGNRGNSTLSVIDLDLLGQGEPLSPFATFTPFPGISSNGLVGSSKEEGYVYVGNDLESKLEVLSDQPFIEFSSPSTSISSEDGRVTLTSSQNGKLSVYQYTGSVSQAISKEEGRFLFSQEVESQKPTEIRISSSSLEEGENLISFFVSNGSRLGRRALLFFKDTVPSAPKNFQLAFGNKKIFARWDRSNEKDLDHYLLFFGTENPEGGVGGISSPISISQPLRGDLHFTLQPIENGTRVFAYVVAVDQTGNQSPPTETLSEVSEETIGILERSGETGGCQTSTNSGKSFLWFLCFLGFWFFSQGSLQRSKFLIFLFFFSGISHSWAEPLVLETPPEKPHSSFEFRLAWWVPNDPWMKAFFGKQGNEIYQLRFGYLLGPFDLGFETGFFRESASMVGAQTERISGETLHLLFVPSEISLQYNLRVTQDPILIPWFRVGYSLSYFHVGESTRSEQGLKHLLTFSSGLRMMLRKLAGNNDARDMFGLHDFFVEGVASYRYSFSKGLDFGGWLFQPGLGVIF